MRSIDSKTGTEPLKKTQKTQLRCEKFRYSVPKLNTATRNSPPLPDFGALDTGSLSTAGVLVIVVAAGAYRFRRPKIVRAVQSVCLIPWSRRRIT